MNAERRCEHADTTTVAWLYGEGPEEHVHHVVACAECQGVADVHERVRAAVAGVAVDVSREDVPSSADVRSRRTSANTWWPWAAGALALAAVALFAVVPLLSGRTSAEDTDRVAVAPAPADLGDDLDRRMDAIDADIGGLQNDLDAL